MTAADPRFPDADEVAALRAWCAGLGTSAAVERYLPARKAAGANARGTLGRLRQALVALALERQRADLAEYFVQLPRVGGAGRERLDDKLAQLHAAPVPAPAPDDRPSQWFAPRIGQALTGAGVRSLAALAVRIQQRKGWWRQVSGLGQTAAREVEAFMQRHPSLVGAGRELIAVQNTELVPWEQLRAPHELDGSKGTLRAPVRSCVLAARNDYEAVQAWLSLHESAATYRAYRKEAERLMLWAIFDRAKPLSSLTTEDAIAYRAFLRRPAPRERWVGPATDRRSPQWRPFQGPLAPRSAAYALSVLGALFRWLVEQRYVLANPFAGVKVKASARQAPVDTSRAFSADEWALVRSLADTLSPAQGWTEQAVRRLVFVLDFTYSTGLRASELVAATLGSIQIDEGAGRWIEVVGKGNKAGRVAIPPLASLALDQYLASRGVSVMPERWNPEVPLLAGLAGGGEHLSAGRLWAIIKRFFVSAAAVLEPSHPRTAQKLRAASTHWMRHTHATHALAGGAALTTVRDNLRHASVSTTSTYLHTDDTSRARQLASVFALPTRAQPGEGK